MKTTEVLIASALSLLALCGVARADDDSVPAAPLVRPGGGPGGTLAINPDDDRLVLLRSSGERHTLKGGRRRGHG